MSNVTLLRFLTAAASALSTVAALDLAGVASVFEPSTAKYLVAAGPAALALKEVVVALGDWFDDGKPNHSFKFGVVCVALALITTAVLTGCTTHPPVTGEFSGRGGLLRILPGGRFELVVDPQPSK